MKTFFIVPIETASGSQRDAKTKMRKRSIDSNLRSATKCTALLVVALWLFLASPGSTFGQAWSGIIASSRAINWTGAGLPATFPDGETTTEAVDSSDSNAVQFYAYALRR